MVGVFWPKIMRMATILRDDGGISGHFELNSLEFNSLVCKRLNTLIGIFFRHCIAHLLCKVVPSRAPHGHEQQEIAGVE